ncbi:MAG TPA: biosynthetic peptidoglycan transglycosylase [Gemmatimonadales bacterium]|nr:biosynthetic peptidoglycan transglycosylase [Gemmatimonadales bacterium]
MKRILRAVFRLGLGAAAALAVWLFGVWPPPVWYRTHWPSETAFMWMRGDGSPVSPAKAETRRQRRTERKWEDTRVAGRLYQPVPMDSISPFLASAVQIGEDNAFPTHGGIDWRSLRHAIGYPRDRFSWFEARDRASLWEVLPRAWERREALRGASTITQQLAKNLYLSPSRNPLRKAKEAVTAYRLESALGKDRILELYLNVVELGDGVWGAEAASRLYFHRGAGDLSIDQAAALAGTLPFPLRSNPGYRPGRMRWRQNLILRRMQGEAVEVPPDVTEDAVPAPPPLPDSFIPPEPIPDSALADSVAIDTTPVPPDSIQ